MILVDSHAHLDAPQFEADLQQVLQRAAADGVAAIVTVGGDVTSSHAAVALARRHPRVFAAVGIHPHEAAGTGADQIREIAALAALPEVVAVGETGLDFYRNLAEPADQRRVFAAQLEMAKQLAKPIIIHDRNAHVDVMKLVASIAPQWQGVLHCFSGDLKMARQALDMGFHLSFAGNLTFKNATDLRSLVPNLPLQRLLVETDCPYLAPHPYRGKRNEPARVTLVVQAMADLLQLPVEEVASQAGTIAYAVLCGVSARVPRLYIGGGQGSGTGGQDSNV